MVATAENFVGNFRTWCNIADYDLFTFGNHYSAQGARIMGST
jgi:hypothetical protein